MTDMAARGKETGSWLVGCAGSTTLADANGAGEGRAISPANKDSFASNYGPGSLGREGGGGEAASGSLPLSSSPRRMRGIEQVKERGYVAVTDLTRKIAA